MKQAALSQRNFRQPRPLELGRLRATKAASSLDQQAVRNAICAHSKAHWGFVDDDDWEWQDLMLDLRGRVRSVWYAPDGTVFWLVTDTLRAVTTIALPSDYE